MMRYFAFLLFAALFASTARCQTGHIEDVTHTRADTLRGKLRPERTAYDVSYYDLQIQVDPERQLLSGYVDIHYRIVEPFDRLQIDLFANMAIDSIVFDDYYLHYERIEDAVFIDFPHRQRGGRGDFRVYYRGQPHRANLPPWDGGFIWRKDDTGAPWIGVSCQGIGASLWWPNKDHLSDEPDSMRIGVSVPEGLSCISNGNLRSVEEEGDYTRFQWFVSYPINNYNVTLYVGRYVHFEDRYTAADGDRLSLDYYVLPSSLDEARKHFEQVHDVLSCYEQFLDKYPFWRDGYALVEAPYLGMEHQSAIAYGNKYQQGYMGHTFIPKMDWDYIIVHETGHEYFGNSLSVTDMAELWIHEAFTTYLEALYVECRYGFADAVRYLQSQRPRVENVRPMLGPRDVNWDELDHNDIYFKGSWMLHTLRHAIADDKLWFDILRGFYRKYALSSVRTEDFIRWVNEQTGRDFTSFFDQYLKYPSIPVLEYHLEEDNNGLRFSYRWSADVGDFNMPLILGSKEHGRRIYPVSGQWKQIHLPGTKAEEFAIPLELFYIGLREVKAIDRE
ncbi:MAG: M1 family metallopeptidase [Saprospiraceae bacterium]|nr:M1 family metallopeptidase [Saprospiraceae bacterium]